MSIRYKVKATAYQLEGEKQIPLGSIHRMVGSFATAEIARRKCESEIAVRFPQADMVILRTKVTE